MTITIKSNTDGVSGAIQVNGVDKVTIGASGITAGSFAPNSIDAAAAALAFSGANQSLATNGYQKLPSGLIIQWGVLGAQTTEAACSVTFPIAFPTACVNVTPTPLNTTSNVSADIIMQVVSKTTTGATLYTNRSANSQGTVDGVLWVAIGY